MKSSLALGLASALTLGTATFVSAQEENPGPPQIPIEEPADTPEPAEPPEVEPVEPIEPAEPTEPTEPAEPTVPEPSPVPEPTPAPGLTIQETTPPATEKPATDTVTPAVSQPQAVACRVVVVDRAAKTITVEAEGQLHLLKLDPQAKVMKKGKLVTLDDVVPGQEIVVLARTTSDGVIQVVSIAIGPAKGKEQAAGAKAVGRANPNGVRNFPFQTFPNPANIGPATTPAPLQQPPGPVVTPST